jgi:hypothetical protein
MPSGYSYIYDVRGMLRNYHIIEEDTLTDRQVEFWIMTQRSNWINKRDTAYIKVDHSFSQSLISDVISIDRSIIPTAVPAGYRILRTKTVLPHLINFKSWDGVISAGPIDIVSERFNHGEYREAVMGGNGRFNKDQIFSFILDDYLYIISKSLKNYWYLISKVAVIGIFDNPRDLGNFRHVTGEPCWTLEMEYPISLDLWNYMKDQIRQNNLEGLYNIPVDKGNDANLESTDKA